MKGMKKKLTSKKTARDPDSRINKEIWTVGSIDVGTRLELELQLDLSTVRLVIMMITIKKYFTMEMIG